MIPISELAVPLPLLLDTGLGSDVDDEAARSTFADCIARGLGER